MLKPTIRKIRNIRGTRVVAYEATLGNVSVQASDAKQAAEACERLAMESLANQGAVLVLHDLWPDETGRFTTWILEYRFGGWGYRMARPMRPGSHCDGHSSCGLNVNDRRDAEIAMQRHWYQNNVEPFVTLLVTMARLNVPRERAPHERAPHERVAA